MKTFSLILFFLFSIQTAYTHPMRQVNFDLSIDSDGTFTIKASLNLAHILLQKEDYDYVEYNRSYRNFISLNNEKFNKLLIQNKSKLLNWMDLIAEGEQLILDISWDLSFRKIIPSDWVDINGKFQHEESLFIPVVITGKLPIGTKSITWTNNWPFLDHSIKVIDTSKNKSLLIWIATNTSENIPIDHLDVSNWQAFTYFLKNGVKHILPNGLDHILFVLCLFLVFSHFKNLLFQISVFTIAHTVTLCFASIGLIQISSKIIEPLIMLSILAMATQNILSNRVNKERFYTIFLFGLLHGLSFANAFHGKNLEWDAFFSALIGFNLGVEIGQIFVVMLAFILISLPFKKTIEYRKAFVLPMSFLIGFYALYLIADHIFRYSPGI